MLSERLLLYRYYVAATGALASAFVLDRVGRRLSLRLIILVFLVANIAQLFIYCHLRHATESKFSHSLLVASLCDWFAQGMVSSTIPLFVAEISPAAHRGALQGVSLIFFSSGLALESSFMQMSDLLFIKGPPLQAALICIGETLGAVHVCNEKSTR